MLDTDESAGLTASGIRADLLATYADQVDAKVLAGLKASWPQVVLIDRGLGDPLGKASVIDVETGAHRPADAPGWYDRQHGRGIKYLTAYANRSSQPAVSAAMGKRQFYRWIATLDGTAHVTPYTPGKTPAAVQCLGAAALGFHADLSLVFEDWWNPDPAAAPTGAPWTAKALGDATTSARFLSEVLAALKAHQ
jgi:hypothetical protein